MNTHDRETERATWRTRRALARRRERSVLASLTIDVDAAALARALQAHGIVGPDDRPSRAALQAHAELLLAQTINEIPECQQPCRRADPPSRLSPLGATAGRPTISRDSQC